MVNIYTRVSKYLRVFFLIFLCFWNCVFLYFFFHFSISIYLNFLKWKRQHNDDDVDDDDDGVADIVNVYEIVKVDDVWIEFYVVKEIIHT